MRRSWTTSAGCLPSLGESDAVFMTPGDLVPGLHVTAEDAPEVAAIKGSLRILDVLAAAVADRQEVPGRADLHRTARRHGAHRRRNRAVGHRGGPRHRTAAQRGPRDVPRHRHLRPHRTRRGPHRQGMAQPRRTRRHGRRLRASVVSELDENAAFAEALDRLWPILTPETLLAPLYSSPERLSAAGADARLFRADGSAWTISDVPLLDELVDLLGRDKAADEAAGTRTARGSRLRRRSARSDDRPRGSDGRRGSPPGQRPHRRRGPGRPVPRTRYPGTR